MIDTDGEPITEARQRLAEELNLQDMVGKDGPQTLKHGSEDGSIQLSLLQSIIPELLAIVSLARDLCLAIMTINLMMSDEASPQEMKLTSLDGKS